MRIFSFGNNQYHWAMHRLMRMPAKAEGNTAGACLETDNEGPWQRDLLVAILLAF